MDREDFAPRLFDTFPAFKARADELFDYFGDDAPGSYLLFEDILVPEIEAAADNNPAYLAQLMSFVEEVAEPGFSNCDDLVQIGLGEWLASSKHPDQIKAAAGPHTAEAIWRAERSRARAERQINASPNTALVHKLLMPRKRGS